MIANHLTSGVNNRSVPKNYIQRTKIEKKNIYDCEMYTLNCESDLWLNKIYKAH